MKDQIPQFLQERLSMKFSNSKKFNTLTKQFMLEYSKFYKWDTDDIKFIFKIMKTGLTKLPKCSYDKCNKDVKINAHGVLTLGCCIGHSNKIRMLNNYDVENISQLASVIDKREKTCIEKYGVTNPMKDKGIQEKLKETMISRYSVTNPMKDKGIQEKLKETMISRYGVENISSLESNKHKVKLTNLEKFGVEYPMQNPKVLEKSQKSAFRRKEYIWKTGEISLVQGYEPIVLKELEEEGYTYNDILTSIIDMPKIIYYFEGKNRRYYPDIFIPKDNIIIEVKSDWTLNLHKEKNQAKFEATRVLGYNFRVEVK